VQIRDDQIDMVAPYELERLVAIRCLDEVEPSSNEVNFDKGSNDLAVVDY
jgi:hypothetical protein